MCDDFGELDHPNLQVERVLLVGTGIVIETGAEVAMGGGPPAEEAGLDLQLCLVPPEPLLDQRDLFVEESPDLLRSQARGGDCLLEEVRLDEGLQREDEGGRVPFVVNLD